ELDDLHRGDALPRDALLGDAPHRRDVRAVLGVLDVARAGKLVALLALLAPALAIALAGDHRVAATGSADPPGRDDGVDRRHAVFDALRMVLDAAGVKEKARPRRPPELGGAND